LAPCNNTTLLMLQTPPPHLLLVHPWITDFAAHDLWAKPAGFLLLAALLRQGGYSVSFVDCLDRHDPLLCSTSRIQGLIPGKGQRFGTGKFPKTPLPTPEVVADLPRRFFRYGLPPDRLRQILREQQRPTLIWVTSTMTYWYPGVAQTIALLREEFPGLPLWLGGTYARLCPEHARQVCGADRVVCEPLERLPSLLEQATGAALSNVPAWSSLALAPAPAWDLVPHLDYVSLLTSRGCPYRCPYCASSLLFAGWQRRSAESLYQEIATLHQRRGVCDFAFHDDALLLDAKETLRPALEGLAHEGFPLRFHCPNGLHIRAFEPDWARLLYESGFETLRLGLETTQPDKQKKWGGKTDWHAFLQARKNLQQAGFAPQQLGVYLLAGLPGQSPQEVSRSIEMVAGEDALPFLCEFSPIPGSALWEEACRLSPYDLAGDPLTHNNTFFACRRPDFSYEHLLELKAQALAARRRLLNP
jgi:radical SAM superfamily enzyme YgiQ (UPF0313 family)